MAALAVLLSFAKFTQLPFGGSVTLFSMLPVCVVAYLFGARWGILCGLVDGLLQAMFGSSSLANLGGNIGLFILMWCLDYILAYGSLGFAGAFKIRIKNRYVAFVAGVILVSAIRFLLHSVSGSLIWGSAWLASFAYNATYMVPECIITVIGAIALTPVLPRLKQITG
jgi:thiamine transporter